MRAWAGLSAAAVGLVLWSPSVARAASSGPGPVILVKVTRVTSSAVSLSWTNPKASSFAGVVVREAKGKTAPKSPTSGTLVANVKKPGRTVTAKGLAATTTYSFALFAYSKGRHYAKGVSITAKTGPRSVRPAITSADGTTFSVGKSGAFTVTMLGSPAPSVIESGALPSGVSFSSSAHALSGKPAAGTGGVYPVTYTARNGVGPAATQHFTLSVDQGPAITSGAATTFSVGVNSAFTVKATGYPAPAITETGTLPSGISFNSSTGLLSGKPAAGAVGTYPVTFTANSAIQHFALTVSTDPACTDTWTGANSSDWNDPGNWSSSQVPGASDWACIPAGGSNEPVAVQAGERENASGFTDAGSLQVIGSLALWGTQQSGVAGTLTVTGQLQVSDAVAVTGTLDLDGGALSGSGMVTIASGATWTIEGGEVQDAELVNSGTATVEAGDVLTIAPGTTVLNDGGLTLLGDSSIDGNPGPCTGLPELNNSGTLTVAATSTGTDTFGLNEFSGLCVTAENSGSVVLSSGTLDVASGTLNLNAGTSVSGPGTLETQGTLAVNTPLSISLLDVEGTLTGSSPVTVTGSLDSDNGSFDGPGTVTVAAGATWSVESTTINGGTVVNDGSAEVGANDVLTIQPGAELSNTASLTMDANSSIDGNQSACPVSAELVNSGTLTVAATSTGTDTFGLNDFSAVCLTVANSGPVVLSSGTLDMASGTLNLNAGTSFSGPGTLATHDSLAVNTPLSISSLDVDGTLTGSSPVTVTGSLDSNRGSFDGPGNVTVAAGATWSVESTTINGGTVVNDGSAEVGANDVLTIQPGAELSNTASLTMDANSSIDGNQSACPAPAELVNSGTLTVAATKTGTDSFSACLTVANSGPVALSSGTLDESSGTLNLNPGTSVSGSGTLQFEGTIAVNTPVSVPLLDMDGGTTEGTEALTVTSALTGGSGTFSGPGTVTIDSGASWAISGTSVTGGEVVSDGPATLGNGSFLSISEGASVLNNSAMTVGANSSVSGVCNDQNGTAALDNAGTLDVAAGNGNTATFSGDQFGSCLTVANTAALELSSGDLDVQSGSLVKLDPGTSVSGSGVLEDSSGTIRPGFSVTIPTLQLGGGVLEVPPGVTVTASSLPSPSGTIQLDGTGSFGQLAAAGAVAVGSLDVFFSSTSYSPACGAAVTVATADSITGTFASVSGGTLPAAGFWQPQSTSTTARAVVNC